MNVENKKEKSIEKRKKRDGRCLRVITKSIVKQTIEMLEDAIDCLEPQRKAEAQSLLNFWRLYLNFLVE